MTNTLKKIRISVDVPPEEHREIKILATMNGQTIMDFVRKTIEEKLQKNRKTRND